jgi:hypothetical protein
MVIHGREFIMQFDFLMCSERSGSNLITKMLDSHPDICGPFPTHMIRLLSTNLYRYGNLSNEKNWEVFLSDAEFLLNNRICSWESDFNLSLAQKGERSLEALIRLVYEQEASVQGKQRLFIKENHVCTFIPYILSHFEDAKFIFLVRDPRDMALTWKEAGSALGGVKSAASVWKQDQSDGITAYGFMKDKKRVFLVKFEELLSDTEKVLQEICNFIAVKYDRRMLNFHAKPIVKGNADRLTSWKDLQKPLIKNNSGLYKEKLSEPEIMYVESICKDEMAFFEYKPDFNHYPCLDKLETALPEENMERSYSMEEQSIYPGFFAANERIKTQGLHP